MGKDRDALRLHLRLVGISLGGHAGRRFYLTTVLRSRLSVNAVVEVYRLRWLIELLNREIKREADLDRCDMSDHARSPCQFRTLRCDRNRAISRKVRAFVACSSSTSGRAAPVRRDPDYR